MEEQQIAKNNLILKTVTGSQLYGTNHADSDLDYQGIFIPPKEYVYGLHRCEQVILQEKHKNEVIDYTCYSLMKFIDLARANNPNIISLLYTPRQRIVHLNGYGSRLIDSRHLFLSKKAYHTFRGYAHSQKNKILTKQAEGKRKELIDKYGYDVKFSYHLLRLLYEALEIFVTGEIVYPSANRQLFIAIRNGDKSLDWVLAEAERIEALVDEAYARSTLQNRSDDVSIEKLLMDLLERFWGTNVYEEDISINDHLFRND